MASWQYSLGDRAWECKLRQWLGLVNVWSLTLFGPQFPHLLIDKFGLNNNVVHVGSEYEGLSEVTTFHLVLLMFWLNQTLG